jgi:hypothetical protein
MTTYTINPAHSGTTEQEVAKAKRIYNAKTKTGEFRKSPSGKVALQFSDVNNKIKVAYICPDSFQDLGEAIL